MLVTRNGTPDFVLVAILLIPPSDQEDPEFPQAPGPRPPDGLLRTWWQCSGNWESVHRCPQKGGDRCLGHGSLMSMWPLRLLPAEQAADWPGGLSAFLSPAGIRAVQRTSCSAYSGAGWNRCICSDTDGDHSPEDLAIAGWQTQFGKCCRWPAEGGSCARNANTG